MFLGISHCQKSFGQGTWNSQSLENEKQKGKKGNPQACKLGTTYEAQLIG
jgi:hypothetical protein